LKPEWWGSPLVQEEKYQEKPVKEEEEEIIIVIVITFCNIFTIASNNKKNVTLVGFDHITICA
jgi:hypothetical protein